MTISRRGFLESSAITAAGLTFGNILGQASVAAQAADPKKINSSAWPRKPEARLQLSFNRDWSFIRPDEAPANFERLSSQLQRGTDIAVLNDAAWERVALPHTVRLEPLDASGGRNYQGICWYQKHFTASSNWRGQTVHLVFQGAMQVADLWLNGKYLTTHDCGYLPFTVDISKHIQFGEHASNVITVRLDNSDNPEVPPGKPQDTLDFVYFGGLYRSVTLEVLDSLHISDPILSDKVAGGGTFVTFPQVSTDSATVQVQTDLENLSVDRRRARVRQELFSADGVLVATTESGLEVDPNSSKSLTQRVEVRTPQLWHPERPYLYLLHTSVLEDGGAGAKTIDDQFARIGIRTFHIDKDEGLKINGEYFFSLGANRHQDHPYVGYALPASAHRRDAVKLREAGFTSYRCHYPQDPAFMDACDELGILAIVSNPGWQFMGDELFRKRVCQNAREMIRRDRNRPCVLLWEAQLNETDNSLVAAELYRIVHEEFPVEGCYAAGDRVGKPVAGFDGWDVEYSRNNGSKPLWIREWGDQVDNWTDQQGSVRVAREWGETAMLTQSARHLEALDEIYAKLDALPVPGTARAAGADLWAGIDYYRGYHHQPFYGSPLDLFRLPKFDYYLFQSQRPLKKTEINIGSGPMIYIANFATFQSPVTVMVFSNCEEVRFSQNGKEIATQKPDSGFHLPHPPFTFRLSQFSELHSMLFATGIAKPGTAIGNVKAEGLVGGEVVAVHELQAPGVPTQLTLVLDGSGGDLAADGSDWVRVYAHVCDKRGTTYPYGDDQITFKVSGEGELIGGRSGVANPVRAATGIATALIRSTGKAGTISVEAAAFGLTTASLKISSREISD
jgi:beta-galactosidase